MHSLLLARIARTAGIVLTGADLILLVLSLLAAIPTIAAVANLVALLPSTGHRRGRGGCRSGQIRLDLRLAEFGQLVPCAAAGSVAVLGIAALVLDNGLAFLDGRVLAASGPDNICMRCRRYEVYVNTLKYNGPNTRMHTNSKKHGKAEIKRTYNSHTCHTYHFCPDVRPTN